MIWNKYRFLEGQTSPQCNIDQYDNITTLFSPLSSDFVNSDAKNAQNGAKLNFIGEKQKIG